MHNLAQAESGPLEWIVVRIEVTDTGYGIKAEDMMHGKLFCELIHPLWNPWSTDLKKAAFNQTEQGRQQGWYS